LLTEPQFLKLGKGAAETQIDAESTESH